MSALKSDELASFHARLASRGKGAKDWANTFTEVEYLSEGKFRATFLALPCFCKLPADIINPSWSKVGSVYIAGINVFLAEVNGTRVTIRVETSQAEWNPQIFLNGVEQICLSEPALIHVDPVNPNYHNNILEWDYGFCKRRLRLIEGAILEIYILDHHPDYKKGMVIKGECNKCGKCDFGCIHQNPDRTCSVYDKRKEMNLLDCIKYPDVDDLLANTAPPECSYWIEYQGEKVQPRDVELIIKSNMWNQGINFSRAMCSEGIMEVVGDEKRFSFNWRVDGKPRVWHYPLMIDDTLTVYSTASDDSIWNTNDPTWVGAHDAASGDAFRTGNWVDAGTYYDSRNLTYTCERAFLFFNTAPLGAEAAITSGVLSLYGNNKTQVDAGHADLHIVEGIQNDPLLLSDFGAQLAKTTSGGSITYAAFTVGAYNDLTLNATGRGWINKVGTTKFCFRVAGDINNSTPTGKYNDISFYANEQGVGFQPRLVVEYGTPSGGLKMIPSLKGHMGYDLKTRGGKARRRIF